MSVGIIGGGFVGQVLKKYYKDAAVYDIDEIKSTHTLDETLGKKYIFISFSLPDNGTSSFESIRLYPAQVSEPRTFIIKSTFVPGTTDKLQQEFRHHHFAYNPEFLTEMTAWEDFTEPPVQILGIPHESLDLANELFNLLPDAPIKRIISPLDAELLKHATNSYYSTKVVFFNELFNIAEQLGADYETVREIMVQDKRIGDSHSKIFHKGYRGFGGKCLPKDTQALSTQTGNKLLETVINLNETYEESR